MTMCEIDFRMDLDSIELMDRDDLRSQGGPKQVIWSLALDYMDKGKLDSFKVTEPNDVIITVDFTTGVHEYTHRLYFPYLRAEAAMERYNQAMKGIA